MINLIFVGFFNVCKCNTVLCFSMAKVISRSMGSTSFFLCNEIPWNCRSNFFSIESSYFATDIIWCLWFHVWWMSAVKVAPAWIASNAFYLFQRILLNIDCIQMEIPSLYHCTVSENCNPVKTTPNLDFPFEETNHEIYDYISCQAYYHWISNIFKHSQNLPKSNKEWHWFWILPVLTRENWEAAWKHLWANGICVWRWQ